VRTVTSGGFLAVALLVCVAADVTAAAKLDPEYEFYAEPVMPSDMVNDHVSGLVRLSYTAHSDGSMSDLKILSKTHRRLANAAIYAAARWRFKPWKVTGDQPASVNWVVNVIFGPDIVTVREGDPL
jgi:protein TonB